MPYFKYKVRNQYGDVVTGKAEARTIEAAAAELSSRGLLVIDLQPLTEDSFAALKSLMVGIKQDDIVNLTRQLATMITAGLPLAGGLSILVRQSKADVSRLVAQILQDVEGGTSFSQALSKHPDHFQRLYIQLVNAGETGGVLDQVLQRLAENLEKSKEFRAKTKGAMIYPAIVVLAMLAVGFIMMVFVIPKLTEMYKDFDADLPFATRALIGVSNFIARFWYIFLGLVAGGIVGLRKWYKTEKASWDDS